jgi:hypothetical protein
VRGERWKVLGAARRVMGVGRGLAGIVQLLRAMFSVVQEPRPTKMVVQEPLHTKTIVEEPCPIKILGALVVDAR